MSIEKPTQHLLDYKLEYLSKLREYARKVSELQKEKGGEFWKAMRQMLQETIDLNLKGIRQELALHRTGDFNVTSSYINIAQMEGVIRYCEDMQKSVDSSEKVLEQCRTKIRDIEAEVAEMQKEKELGVI